MVTEEGWRTPGSDSSDMLERARQEDTAHRARTQKPISAVTLRVRWALVPRRLGVSSRSFVPSSKGGTRLI
jgi:hypothetical protein